MLAGFDSALFPARDDRDLLHPGMPRAATVLSPNAGVIGTIASILLWVSASIAYQ
jgi:hypothetical protein